MTKVNVRLGFTMNLGDFESLRLDVGVEDDVREGESVTDAFGRVYGFVEDRVIDKQNEFRKELSG